jgi:6-pyruvoyltetrahydropterin/6-carboxytetrahydropterin synthase
MKEIYLVRLEKRELTFSAAHFITFENGQCERLHGHNYHVAVEVEGPLGEAGYVVDFLAFMAVLKRITGELDHHVLLPTEHRLIHILEEGNEVVAEFESRRWVFPAEDCVLLPLKQTTAELLARHIAGRTLEALASEHHWQPVRIRVEVDECDGQRGVFENRSGER